MMPEQPQAEESHVSVPEPAAARPPVHSLGALSLLRDVAISVVLAVVLIVFIYQPVKVEGTSMMPGLTDQDRIFINKYEYKIGSGQIQRSDLVVFHFPLDPSQSYIKRVIGLPGDEVEIVDGDVYVNGQMQEEAYVPAEYRDHIPLRRETVPPNKY